MFLLISYPELYSSKNSKTLRPTTAAAKTPTVLHNQSNFDHARQPLEKFRANSKPVFNPTETRRHAVFGRPNFFQPKTSSEKHEVFGSEFNSGTHNEPANC